MGLLAQESGQKPCYSFDMLYISMLVFLHLFPALVTGMCPYIDAHWRVNHNRGLQKFHEDNSPEPPLVTQVGPARIRVKWGHLVKDAQCVDRFILHVWDTKQRLMR